MDESSEPSSPTAAKETLYPPVMGDEKDEEIIASPKKEPNQSNEPNETTPSTIDADTVESGSTPAAAVLSRPAKRARTAYFLFAEEKRKEVQEQLPGQGVAAVAKGLGVLWAQLTDEEKKVYQERAQQEKERLAQELLAWKEAGGELVEEELLPASTNNSNGGLVYQLARVRKICKLDPEVRGLSKEALLLITKAAEAFTSKIGTETMRVASIQNRRKLQAGDVAQVCASRKQFLFLREDIADLARLQLKEAQQEKELAASSKNNEGASSASKAPPFAAKPLTSYFGVKS